ncbi:MAG: CDP-diacylglycerol--serine O-phosphatidyltransferase [Candidatus Glassbacteria bacterium RIFCSPLOWO2_12_FULL_58_11]|uniref:CDP-diacylglycerol--serine O-phosphatidyltransferase n=2 Tax=Candidatus Glassiibacteriota TaxID=1817805 RepID=A0A1F5YMM1_9BACT|nr:MAG: CDP-diacylglycerol--serine O-phosphatidyltransferase [Candidatus Glassbacteria bacterium GWA2_58_10]OGG01354.1 MAG: CDP-diacylglycerol--serine O-phosphatidyltransferase [Candidatus Glassbacteria bacterium RIFCSPLOWO2_12_FULL_58_11]
MPRKSFLLPSAFTSGSIFCGFYSAVSAMREDLELACWLIVVAGILDYFDGKVALFSGSESRFGVELDSLADIISFGIAPGIIMYQFFLRDRGEWSWLVSFLFVLCGALRLARFNVETKGAEKTNFKGLPTPMAAGALISFVPFSRSPLFHIIFYDVNYSRFLVSLILILAGLMVSNVEYPAAPGFNFHSFKGILGFVIFVAIMITLIYQWKLLMFPAAFIYIFYGFSRSIILGAVSRLPDKNG